MHALYTACLTENLPRIKEILAMPDIDVSQPIENGNTALHMACFQGNVAAITLLLAHSSSRVNAINNERATALLSACWRGQGMAVTLLLRSSGIDFHLAANDGATPLMVAWERGHINIVIQIATAISKQAVLNKQTQTALCNLFNGDPCCKEGHRKNTITSAFKKFTSELNQQEIAYREMQTRKNAAKSEFLTFALCQEELKTMEPRISISHARNIRHLIAAFLFPTLARKKSFATPPLIRLLRTKRCVSFHLLSITARGEGFQPLAKELGRDYQYEIGADKENKRTACVF